MVEKFSDLNYVHQIRSTNQEDNLSGNMPLKYGLTHLVFKLTDIIHTVEYFLNSLSDQ